MYIPGNLCIILFTYRKCIQYLPIHRMTLHVGSQHIPRWFKYLIYFYTLLQVCTIIAVMLEAVGVGIDIV